MTRTLNRGLVEELRAGGSLVVLPTWDMLELPEHAVQFGTGALLRGFVDDFLHRANAAGTFNGRIVAIASTGSTRDKALSDQDGLYTLVVEGIERGERVQQSRVISSLSRAISATENWAGVLKVARSPELQYVFSNTTEVGIVADAESGRDDMPPRSFPAKLTRFLYERATAFDHVDEKGVIVIPCELIENNGTKLRQIVLDIAARWDLGDQFSAWIERAVPFCNTLVDRIVPGSPRADDAKRLRDLVGYDDAMLTCCEPYCLFAIEGDDVLRAKMPWTWVDAGIVVAPDIAPYRKRKVHLLNGAHSLIAPLALAMGCETVLDAMNTPAIAQFAHNAMLDEIAPTLNVEGAAEFAEAVLDRFRNPFIRHALIDITLQATMKMRVRNVPSIERSVAVTGRVPQSLAFGFAGFLLFMKGDIQAERKVKGLSVPVDDQASRLHSLWSAEPGDNARLVASVCRDTALWGTDLSAIDGFCESVAGHLERMRTQGVSAALEHLLQVR
ncbi:MAG: Mannitol dehydrogenase protein [Gemmatimonadetes bacterium]|nr:Mannitol dehydrogenase protein [Gemmatimonadota bacterium]